jgi:hypothetical protein
MFNVLSYVLLTTSILLLFFTVGLLKTKKALERELLTLKDRPPDTEAQKLKDEAILEIEKLKNLEKTRLEEELSLKRRQNDEEIKTKQESIDRILEDYKKSQELAIAAKFEADKQNLLAEYEDKKRNYEDEILSVRGQLILEQAKIEQLRRNQIEVTEAIMREALLKEEYHLNISDNDKMEIKELQMVAAKYVRIRPVILKAVYEIYYAPEVKKLVARVVGKTKVCGIYRITSRIDGRIYIGKSVDIAARWQTHFKRAAGVETETTNLLYPAMRQDGLDQFSFEIIEKVEDDTKLGEREKYWQEFYDAKSHGFSVR